MLQAVLMGEVNILDQLETYICLLNNNDYINEQIDSFDLFM